jgi:thiol-disulfide isomerase/thioredoxin
MKKTVWINLILLTLLLAGALGSTTFLYQSPPTAITSIPDERPDITVTALNGRDYRLYDFDGKFLIVNLWASWCTPCVAEFPHLMDVAERNRDKVTIIALSSDFGVAEIERFLSRLNRKVPDNMVVVHDDEGKITHNIFKTYQLPETFIYGPKGDLRKKLIGADWTVQDMEVFLR